MEFMPPRTKKARVSAVSKSDLVATLDQDLHMIISALATSHDQDVVAASILLGQQADQAKADPVNIFTAALSACSDEEIEKLVALSGGTNTPAKYECFAGAYLKPLYSLIQTRELQNKNLKAAAVIMAQLMVAGAFSNNGGVIAWSGEQGLTVQAAASHVLKEKCRRAGAAAAAANAAAGRG